jgi:regulatory protein
MSAASDDGGSRQQRFHGEDQASSDTVSPHKRPNDPERRAQDLVYRQLAVRARSHAELMQALRRNGIEEDIATRVLQKFCDAGLVDDAAFAESWVRERHRHRGLSRQALDQELRRKGVDENLIATALSIVDDEAQVERAHELVRRKLPTMTKLDSTTRFRRLVGMLARKGYSEALAFRVVRKELEGSGLDTADSDATVF